jgi:hypothetical protein
MARTHINWPGSLIAGAIFLLGGCTVEVDWQPLDQPLAVKPLPVIVGTYFSSRFGYYEHVQYDDSTSVTFLIGSSSLRAFEQIISGMFETVIPLKSPSPVGVDEPVVDVVMEPTIAAVELRGAGIQRAGMKRASITYSVTMSLPDGGVLASWDVTGIGVAECEHLRCISGEEVGFALRDAMANFVIGFYEQPEIKRWMKSLEEGAK